MLAKTLQQHELQLKLEALCFKHAAADFFKATYDLAKDAPMMFTADAAIEELREQARCFASTGTLNLQLNPNIIAEFDAASMPEQERRDWCARLDAYARPLFEEFGRIESDPGIKQTLDVVHACRLWDPAYIGTTAAMDTAALRARLRLLPGLTVVTRKPLSLVVAAVTDASDLDDLLEEYPLYCQLAATANSSPAETKDADKKKIQNKNKNKNKNKSKSEMKNKKTNKEKKTSNTNNTNIAKEEETETTLRGYSILKWWKANSKRLPAWSKWAPLIAVMQPSSGGGERLSDIVTSDRSHVPSNADFEVAAMSRYNKKVRE